MRVAVVTAREAVGQDVDEPLLLAALERAGGRARVLAWDDPDVDWSGVDLAVVRSAWDYARRRDEFLAWARRVSSVTRLCNPEPVLAWNTDKAYLRELERAGLPVVPTTWLEPGDPVTLPPGEVVVKPSVSAGSRDTARYPAEQAGAATAHAAALLAAGRTVMVQPYLASVDTAGETAVVHLGGGYSHAARKGPLLHPGQGPTQALFAEETIDRVEPTQAQRAVADAVLGSLGSPGGPGSLGPPGIDTAQLAYARVDLVAGADGSPLLLELELTEPSLFLLQAPEAADRLAAVLLRG